MEIAQPIAQPITSELAVGISNGLFGNVGFNTLAFHALYYDPVTFQMLGVLRGTGDITEARTGNAVLQPDHEGVWRSFAAGVPAWRGGRVVTNNQKNSDDITQAGFGAVRATASSADTLIETSAAGDHRLDMTPDIAFIDNHVYIVRMKLKPNGRDWVRVSSNTPTNYVNFDLVNGVTGTIVGTTGHFMSAATDSDGYWVVGFSFTASTTAQIKIQLATGNNTISYTGDGVSGINVKNIQIEDSTGRTDTTTPSEYIPTTTAAVQRVYANANGNTVDGANVVTENVGAVLSSLPVLYSAPAYTNEIPYSRDLTQTGWSDTSIAAYDAVGLTGVANTASTLTDSDAAAIKETNWNGPIPNDSNPALLRVLVGKDTNETRFPSIRLDLVGGTLQRIGVKLNTKTGSPYVWAATGTVNHEVNQVGNQWEVLVEVDNNSSGNLTAIAILTPARGSTLTTDSAAATGSIIDANTSIILNKSIAQARGSSPIFTAGAAQTLNATADSFDIANHNNTQGGYFIKWTPQFATSEASGNIEIISLNGGADCLFYDATNSLLKSTDGTNTASVALTVVAGTTYKCWVAWGSSLQVGVDASTGTATSYDGAFAVGTKIEVCARTAYVQLANQIERHNTTFPAAVIILQALAA